VPAAAVIPAPRAYINVVAVKKPVVGFESIACGSPLLPSGCEDSLATHRRCSEACGIVHWPKAHLLGPEATSERLHSIRCARRRHCE